MSICNSTCSKCCRPNTEASKLFPKSHNALSLLRGESSSSSHASQFLADVESHIKWVDDEIDRLYVHIFALENQRGDLKRKAQLYRSLNSPVRRLPPEVLAQIFMHYCNKNVFGDCGSVPALTLASVCNIWRATCLTTPALWSTIKVSLSVCRVTLSGLDSYLTRSAQVPLDITVVQRNDEPDDFPILSRLVQDCARWRHLTLDLDEVLDVFEVFRPIQNHLPLLETLRIDIDIPSEVKKFSSLFEAAPKLRSMELSYACARDLRCLPWHQVTFLTVQNHDGGRRSLFEETVFFAVKSCPNLQFLNLEDDGSADENTYDNVKLSSSIRSLTLPVGAADDFHRMISNLSYIDMPHLNSLHIKPIYGAPLCPVSGLLKFVTSSNCTLTSLSLANLSMTTETCIVLFEALQSLTSFTYLYKKAHAELPTPLSDSLFAALHSQNSSNVLLPKLSEFSISIPNLTFTERAFVDMVKSRFRGSAIGNSEETVSGETANLKVVELRVLEEEIKCKQDLVHLQRFTRQQMKVTIVDRSGLVI